MSLLIDLGDCKKALERRWDGAIDKRKEEDRQTVKIFPAK